MDPKKLVIITVVIVFIVAFFVITAMNAMTKRKHMSESQKYQAANKRFRFYYDFVLTRSMFRKVYGQVCALSAYTMLEGRLITVKFFEKALLTSLALFCVGYIGMGDLVSGIVMLMFAYVMLDVSISKRIDSVNYQSLIAMSGFIQSIRECYTRVRNVPDAVNDANVSPLLQRQATDIYLICTANDAEERLNEFYRTCPNRIMRTLATTCYIRTDAGEDQNGYSPFKQALGLIKDEVDMERRRQLNQRLQFSSLDKLPFVPLFMYPPIKIFYTKMISATASVFDSMVGYVIKLVVVVACFVSYYVLSTINNSSVAKTDDRILAITNAMNKHSVQKFAKTLVTKKYKTRKQMQEKINGCLSSKTLDYLYLEKLVFAVALFFISIIFSIMILFAARNAVYNSLSASTMSVTLKYTADQEAKTRAYDAEVIASGVLPTEEEMTDKFEDIFPKATSIEIEAQVDRLTDKCNTYWTLGFKWWFAFIYIALFFVGWCVPNFLLKLRVTLVKSEAEIDVLQLQTIIAILMDTNLDTMNVIYWLSRSSDIHKDILTYCYHEYVRDPEYALNHLKSKSANPEFSAMCDKLITTIFQVTLAEAFEDLISERDNTMKIREAVQLEDLKKKRNIAGPIATFPMIVWMVAVFILPIGIVAVKSAISMLGQLNM